MTQKQSKTATREQRLHEVIGSYLDAAQAGDAPDRQELLARYPDLACELEAFFADHDKLKQLAEPLRPVAQAAQAQPDTAAVAPTEAYGKRELRPPTGKLRHFGDYELIEEIARGGMGIVYKARQASLNRIVAVKMILAGQLASEADVKRFRSEAEAAANLRHPNIVAIHEVGEHEGQHYFSMDYVEGKSLAELIRDHPLSATNAAEYVQVIASAVQFAHEHHILHRDLKPSNVLVDTSGRLHITDFGLAKRISSAPPPSEGGVRGGLPGPGWRSPEPGGNEPRPDDTLEFHDQRDQLTASGAMVGTPSYMSPEQVAGKRGQVGPASDIYSLGAILYELLTGRPPFRAATRLDTVLEVLESEPVPPRQSNPKVPRNLETICLKCLAKAPQQRYQSAQALADDLERYLQGEPIVAKQPGPIARLARWARCQPALAATFAALAVFYTIHLVCLYVLQLPREGGVFHWFISGMVLIWALGAWAFQQLMLRTNWHSVVPYGWAAMDVLMLSGFLLVANGPISAVVIGYLLLVAGAGLRFRIGLVWFVSALCTASYLALVLDARWYRPQFVPAARSTLYFALSLLIMGLIMHLMLRRFRASALRDSRSTPAGLSA